MHPLLPSSAQLGLKKASWFGLTVEDNEMRKTEMKNSVQQGKTAQIVEEVLTFALELKGKTFLICTNKKNLINMCSLSNKHVQ